MKHRLAELYYFTFDAQRAGRFREWIGVGTPRSLCYVKGARFSLLEKPLPCNVLDLVRTLEQYEGNLQSLHVLLDIACIPAAQAADLRQLMASYPEVQFLFDRRTDVTEDFRARLFPEAELARDIRTRPDREEVQRRWQAVLDDICVSLLELNWENPDVDDDMIIRGIICGRDNSFDASNLRYALKFRKYVELNVDCNRNFARIQDSRRKLLAISVEQQTLQNTHDSYALYANGFRVLPVSTRQELSSLSSTGLLQGKGLVVRGYDLQFEDEGGESVDEIRGYKYCDAADLEDIRARKGRAASSYKAGWNDFTCNFEGRNNRYWKPFVDGSCDFPVFFVTESPLGAVITRPARGCGGEVSGDGEKLSLHGLQVPVCGIYHSFQQIPRVREVFESVSYSPSGPDYRINTSRNNHDHSAPLDLYGTARLMISRAEAYLGKGRLILAALLAWEAIEYMNGFHHRLMVRAYHVLSKAENAIAMKVVGGDKRQLTADTELRVNKIRCDIARIYCGQPQDYSENTLSQIFSDCRQICRETEHFDSESIFISAMGHQLEGYPLGRLFDDIKNFFRR